MPVAPIPHDSISRRSAARMGRTASEPGPAPSPRLLSFTLCFSFSASLSHFPVCALLCWLSPRPCISAVAHPSFHPLQHSSHHRCPSQHARLVQLALALTSLRHMLLRVPLQLPGFLFSLPVSRSPLGRRWPLAPRHGQAKRGRQCGRPLAFSQPCQRMLAGTTLCASLALLKNGSTLPASCPVFFSHIFHTPRRACRHTGAEGGPWQLNG